MFGMFQIFLTIQLVCNTYTGVALVLDLLTSLALGIRVKACLPYKGVLAREALSGHGAPSLVEWKLAKRS